MTAGNLFGFLSNSPGKLSSLVIYNIWAITKVVWPKNFTELELPAIRLRPTFSESPGRIEPSVTSLSLAELPEAKKLQLLKARNLPRIPLDLQ